MENKVRVIDQNNALHSQAQMPVSRLKPCSARKSSLPSLDLATRTSNKPTTSGTIGRRCMFNDAVEVYYYPENREQHDHHLSEEFDDEDEESLRCEEPKITESEHD